MLFVPVLSFPSGDALGEHLDARISPRTRVVVDSRWCRSSLPMTCRQSHRRALPLLLLAAGLPADDFGGEESHQLVAGNELALGEPPVCLAHAYYQCQSAALIDAFLGE